MKTRLQELTLKDNFLFGAVMLEPSNCKGLLEMTLGTKIGRIEVDREKSIVYHPEYKGVRLDVYAKDEKNSRYNVEMQVLKAPALGKRSRYYQSQMDMEILLAGEDYSQLPSTYVIFICDFDPFGEKKYRYTFRTKCEESQRADLEDGRYLIFLSTRGENESEVPKELVTFLKFVKADLKGSQEDFCDDYVEQLQNFISKIKKSREMEERFMLLEEVFEQKRAEGRAEGRLEGRTEGRTEGMSKSLITVLSLRGAVPEDLQEKISREQDIEKLSRWLEYAVKADSVEEFISKISQS